MLYDLPNENERLNELFSFDILDSITEKDYDDITRLAAIICDTPVALISFVGKDRQWFKSHFGTKATETPREVSFCAHAIRFPKEPFIIEDTRVDERFKENPLVTDDPNIVFYAGIPLVSDNDMGLGTVCVIDTKPRTLTEDQIDALKILSKMTMNLLRIRKTNKDLNADRGILKAANAELGQSKDKLKLLIDDQASKLLKEIEDRNTILAKTNKELESFAYISSHDLQEPLRKIQTFTSWIIAKESENLTDRGKEYLEKIVSSSNRMSILIRDLLAYSRTTSSEKKYEATTLADIVDDVMVSLEVEVAEKGATFEICEDCEMDVISFQFRQLIYNLVSNSLKFCKDDCAPHISFSCKKVHSSDYPELPLKKDEPFTLVSVTDNGIGFGSQYNEKIFELFQRVSSRQVEVGTGIGLAIVKKIVDNHDGYITAKSEDGDGATFHIFVPDTKA